MLLKGYLTIFITLVIILLVAICKTYMSELSERQKALLRMIIEEFVSSAEPISSSHLTNKYRLNVSAATIRNEMAHLIRQGFLDQPHISAGRIPTPLGYRYYIQNLMTEDSLPVLKEVSMKQNVWNSRYEFDKLLRSAASSLSDATHLLSIVSTDDGRVYSSGVVNILDHAEFFDIEVSKAVFNMLDNYTLLADILSKRNTANTCVILGEEFERETLYPVSAVAKSFTAGNKKGNLIVIGPSRMPYKEVIPAIRYMSGILEELGSYW